MKNLSSQPKAVGIWVRVSTDMQAQGDSPEIHERRARDFVSARGWTVKEVYQLAGVSGKDVIDHPEAKRMLADVERGHITALIFSKLARLARNTRQLLELSERFQKAQADLIALDDAIDTSTPSGRMFFTLQAAQAQWEREEIASRIGAAFKTRAKLGKRMGGRAPFGYRWNEKDELVINEQEAPIRKLVHELYIEHRRRKHVARILNERGYRTREGRPWTDGAIEWMLCDPTAKGLRRSGYIKAQVKGKAKELRPVEEWHFHPCPAIVSAEVWDKAYAIFNEVLHSRAKPAKKPVHLLAGKVVCECGRKMYVKYQTAKYRCTGCYSKIPIGDLEECFVEELKNYLISPEEMARYVAKADETLQSKTKELSTLKDAQAEAQRKVDKAFELYSLNKLTGDQFGRVFDPLNEQLTQLSSEVPKVQATVEILKLAGLKPENLVAESKSLFEAWPHLNFDEKRAIVENLVTSITVEKGGGLAIELAYFPVRKERVNWQTIPKVAGGKPIGWAHPPDLVR